MFFFYELGVPYKAFDRDLDAAAGRSYVEVLAKNMLVILHKQNN
jgi:hypothetical protein